MKKRIAILVDNPSRDLPACTLLAAGLVDRFELFLVPTAQANTDLFRLQPDLVVLNYLRENNRPMVERLVQCGIQFSILDTEGGLFMQVPNSPENTYTMTLIKDVELRNQVAQVFVWGEELTDLLKARKIYPIDSILCLGTPRMDFFSEAFQNYFPKPAKKPDRPMVLINTSFAGNNPRYSNRDTEMKMLIEKYSYTKEFIDQFFKDLDTVLSAYIELTKKMAHALPSVDFVLRPHPFESSQIYRDHFKHLKNLRVDGSGTSADWLWKAEALIHYECSTAVEAAFLKKPNFSLAKYQEMRPNPFIQSLTHYSKDEADLTEKIQQVLSGKYESSNELDKNLGEVEKKIYFRVDGKSYLRIAQAINDWLQSELTCRSFAQKTHAFGIFLLWGIRSLAKKIIKGSVVPEGKGLVEGEVSQICQQLQNVLNRSLSHRKVPFSSSFEITP